MFRKHIGEHFIIRFMEFDEARVYIENMKKDEEKTLSAIDYMITHKEYYFLLKNLLKNIQNGTLDRKIYEYALLSYNKCPCEPEELEIIEQIIRIGNPTFIKPMEGFLKPWSCRLKEFLLSLLEYSDYQTREFAKKVLRRCPEIREFTNSRTIKTEHLRL